MPARLSPRARPWPRLAAAMDDSDESYNLYSDNEIDSDYVSESDYEVDYIHRLHRYHRLSHSVENTEREKYKEKYKKLIRLLYVLNKPYRIDRKSTEYKSLKYDKIKNKENTHMMDVKHAEQINDTVESTQYTDMMDVEYAEHTYHTVNTTNTAQYAIDAVDELYDDLYLLENHRIKRIKKN